MTCRGLPTAFRRISQRASYQEGSADCIVRCSWPACFPHARTRYRCIFACFGPSQRHLLEISGHVWGTSLHPVCVTKVCVRVVYDNFCPTKEISHVLHTFQVCKA